MVRRGWASHAILLVGPDGVGKTTLALDLAAGLLCEAAPDARPCRACRACRMVDHDGHPDIHRLAPVGPGRQVVIGGPGARFRGVRDLISELALLPVEGRARVAIIEGAERMNEDAQSALLKTLEEPPPGVVIVLCADEESRLLPTIRSRCARLRLGLVGSRDIEAILGDQEIADPPLAARLGRLAGGRPGLALALARAPEAVMVRGELSRLLLDLTDAGPAARLAAVRAAVPRAMDLVAALRSGGSVASPGKRLSRSAPQAEPPPYVSEEDDASVGAEADDPRARSVPATERRRAADMLLSLWADVARDLALVAAGGERSVRDPVLIDDLAAVAPEVEPVALAGFLARADRGSELLANNVSPELLLDSLALAWPRRRSAA
jgi:DNA polymerase-3 subunit delta'